MMVHTTERTYSGGVVDTFSTRYMGVRDGGSGCDDAGGSVLSSTFSRTSIVMVETLREQA